eukprot:2103646-Rhodomonas_salina.2
MRLSMQRCARMQRVVLGCQSRAPLLASAAAVQPQPPTQLQPQPPAVPLQTGSPAQLPVVLSLFILLRWYGATKYGEYVHASVSRAD